MGAVKGKILESIVCHLCDYSTKRITSFEKHLQDVHQINSQTEWLRLDPNRTDRCECGCGEQTAWNGWKNGFSRLKKGHNANIYSGLYSKEEAEQISAKRSQSLKGQQNWSKGLTKELDERVAKRAKKTSVGRKHAFNNGKLSIWSKGLTKETDQRLAFIADNLKEGYETGKYIPWAKGLTKKSDTRIAAMAANVSLKLRETSLRHRLDEIKRLKYDEITSRIEVHDTLEVVDGLENYVNDASRVINVRCKTCGTMFISSLRQLQYGRCWNCTPVGSAAQGEIDKFVRNLVGSENVRSNDRSTFKGKLELDIYVPDKKFAIEYNGLYWHSILFKSNEYHANKTTSCYDQGIKLLHVFQDDWANRRQIVESTIKHRLGLSARSIGARKCKVVVLDPKSRKKFFEETHLDGDVASKIAWGLEYKGEIVYALSLRKPFHKKYNERLEIGRCAAALDTSVPGGLSRLTQVAFKFARAQRGIKGLITYVDTRLGGLSSGYSKAGFTFISVTQPRFWWTDFNKRYDRFKYKANKNLGLSEAQVADDAGVVKIWGCGNLTYIFDFENNEQIL